MNTPRKKKLYVLLRKDLDETYRCVQGGHAIAEYSLKDYQSFKEWANGTLIYLGVPDLKALELWLLKLERKNIFHIRFHEPDLGNELTSVACINTGKIFKSLPLA